MGNEYDAVIADLEAQKAEIELLIVGLRKRAGQSPDGGGPSGREIHREDSLTPNAGKCA